MPIYHAFTNPVADATGTITVGNLSGGTTTAAASNLQKPSDWNSAHNFQFNVAGNTTGGSSVSGTDVSFAAAGNLLVSAGAGSVVYSIPPLSIYLTSNTLGFSSSTEGTDGITFGASGGLSVGYNGGGQIIFSAPDPAVVERRYKEIIPGERMTTIAGLSATAYSRRPLFQPFWMEGTGLQPKTIRFIMSFGASSNRSLIGTFHVGLYGPVNATNSTQMTLLTEDTISFSSTNTAASASWNGIQWFDFTGASNTTLVSEGRHVLAFMVRPNAADVSNMPVTLYGADNMPAVTKKMVGGATAAIAASEQIVPWWGAFSTTTAAMPGSIGVTQINGGSSVSQLEIYAVLREL